MPRPPKYPEHKLEAYGYYQNRKADSGGVAASVSTVDVLVDLEAEHPEGMASYRLIANWVREFKQQDEWQTLLDSPFQWHRMQEYGLPWEASRIVVDLLDMVEEHRAQVQAFHRDSGRKLLFALGSRRPTARQIRWCWRVHQAAPEIGTEVGHRSDLWFLAMRFSDRELCRDVLGLPLSMGDLETLLVYRPWLGWPDDNTRHQRYHDAVDGGLIPPMQGWEYDRKRLINARLPQSSDPGQELNRINQVLGGGDWDSGHPELLDSQELVLVRQQAKETRE